ncbi:MAG: histidine phosphatase family protein [Arenimonas sp.]
MTRLILAVLLLVVSLAQAAEPAASPAPHTIVLVRHGHYLPDPTADAKLGPGLSRLGIAQSRVVGARLARMSPRFDALYVSPLQRARDTAATVAGKFPGQRFTVIGDLAECTPPTRDAQVIAGEESESAVACQAQLERVFAKYFQPAVGKPRTELFVCHGNVTRYLATRALGVDSKAWPAMSVGHASITRIRIEANGSIHLIALGDVGHLPANLLTGTIGDAEPNLAIAPPKMP